MAPNQGALNSGVDSRRASTLVACTTPKFEQFLKGNPETIPGVAGRSRSLPTLAGEQWRLERYRWYAYALAADAVVGAFATAGPKDDVSYHVGWFDRNTGGEQAAVDLPGEPRVDGLAVASDGTIVVQLLDGGVVALRSH